MKHTELDYHTVCEKINKCEVKIAYVQTKNQIANLFTKPLRAPAFQMHLIKLGVINIYIPTWEKALNKRN